MKDDWRDPLAPWPEDARRWRLFCLYIRQWIEDARDESEKVL